MSDTKSVPVRRYSGPGRSGVCVCGCSWEDHHLGVVMRQEYIDATGEGYIPGACDNFGWNEHEGERYNEETGEWEDHCYGYRDSALPDEHN